MCTINEDYIHPWYDVWLLRYQVQQTKLFCRLGHFFALLPPWQPKKWKYQKWKKTLEISSFYTSVPKIIIIRYTVPEMWCETDVFILGYAFSFYPPNSPKNENFKKMKRAPGDIIIEHKCTKNHDHVLYCSWDMAHGRCNFYFSFLASFAILLP